MIQHGGASVGSFRVRDKVPGCRSGHLVDLCRLVVEVSDARELGVKAFDKGVGQV